MSDMSSLDEALAVMDLLDLEESVIDLQLNKLMSKKSLTSNNFNCAKHLLQYKLLLNTKEKIDGDNEKEFNFVVKLIEDLRPDTIEVVCKILAIILSLNKETIVFKSEHLLQQMLANLNDLHEEQNTSMNNGSEKITKTDILLLQVCETIMDLVLSHGKKLSLPFLNIPYEKIFQNKHKNLQLHFLSHTVPKLLESLIGYNVLDKIWDHIEQLNGDHKVTSLNILCHLSDYYLPTPDHKGNIYYRSNVVKFNKFWDIVLYGLMSNNVSLRKIAIYIIKKAIECLIHMKINVCIKLENKIIFEWNIENEMLKSVWDSYFILMESLEEKQSTIVMPSLQLFQHLHNISNVWLNCLYKLGLEHVNFQIKVHCINQRLAKSIETKLEAEMLLRALNDQNIYDGYEVHIKKQMNLLLMDSKSLFHILNIFSKISWSPVPLYHMIHVICSLPVECFEKIGSSVISKILIDILNIPCNHSIIRKALHVDLLRAFCIICQFLELSDCINILIALSKCDIEVILTKHSYIYDCIQKRYSEKDRDHIAHNIFQNPNFLDFGLIFSINTCNDKFLQQVSARLDTINDVIKRQYCSRRECLNDVIFILTLFHKLRNISGDFDLIKNLISNEHKILWRYVITMLTEETKFHCEEILRVFEGLKSIIYTDDTALDILKNAYNMSFSLLKEKNAEPDKNVICLCIIQTIMDNNIINKLYINDKVKHDNLTELIGLVSFQSSNIKYDGKLRNIFYEKACVIVSIALYNGYKDAKINEIVTFIQEVLEKGGYGCLKWILKILNCVLPSVLHVIPDNINNLFERIWKEITFNNHYSLCIEEFVKLITQNCLTDKCFYNNMILKYCNEIVENGSIRKVPLYFLARELKHKIMTLGVGGYKNPLLNVFCEILLYSPVTRKDQRIVEKLICEIINNSKYEIDKQNAGVYFNINIQLLAVETLSSIKDQKVLENIANFMMKKIDDTFKNKARYHANSQAHNTLLIALQHLLLFQILNSEMMDLQTMQIWSLNLLAKLPHQPNVRACLEWIIALTYYRKNYTLDLVIKELKTANVPFASQFLVIYLLAKHNIISKSYTNEENEFVMDFLLTHSMGQIYNIRLHAQYLALKLYEAVGEINKHSCTVDIIKKTFSESATDKNFLKLQQDYFANDFDIVGNLTPSFIYYALPRYNQSEVSDYLNNFVFEGIDLINKNLTLRNVDNKFTKEWNSIRKPDCDIFCINFHKKENTSIFADVQEFEIIQKKYIPWRNMTELDTFKSCNKNNNNSDLIVVASLIDKIPNLGGMARTNEIFGVKKYVIDSKRYLQDQQFQSLSVSAERWLEIEEVRPGPALKKYLMDKKNEGYSVVAAEQTSNSISLQSFKFPMKTLLLLGHEKEGIPCDLLSLMDYCVEIPQQGFVRSLNVHVTASIFIWEYSRQNILKSNIENQM